MSDNKQTPTPHIAAAYGEIAPTAIMCGDPDRAKYIATGFLENTVCYSDTRGALGYTGLYKDKSISVQTHGMGMPSAGIYSYELFNFYNVDNIIRIGTAGAVSKDVKLNSVVLAMGACFNSKYVEQFEDEGSFAPIASYQLLKESEQEFKKDDIDVHVGNILSDDVYYRPYEAYSSWDNMNILAVEMEIAAIYANAARAKKNALGILSITCELCNGSYVDDLTNQSLYDTMITNALNVAVTIK